MKRIVLAALLLISLAACTPPLIGWRPLELAELEGTANYFGRTQGYGDGLSTDGDFDGDGKADHALIMVNDARRRFAIDVVTGARKRYRIKTGDVTEVAKIALYPVVPGTYNTICDNAPDPKACKPKSVKIANSAIDLTTYEVGGGIYYWTGKTYAYLDTWVDD